MIEAIMTDYLEAPVEGLRILDIGCGNGDISRHFARRNQVIGVDIRDQLKGENRDLKVVLVASELLPFADASFDLVLSHHVIEHVEDQRLHLEEIRRVLVDGGVCYLGTPNRSSPFMRGHVGNTQVLRYRQMIPLFCEAGFEAVQYSCRMVKEPDFFHYETRLGRWFPMSLIKSLRPWIPSHFFVLRART